MIKLKSLIPESPMNVSPFILMLFMVNCFFCRCRLIRRPEHWLINSVRLIVALFILVFAWKAFCFLSWEKLLVASGHSGELFRTSIFFVSLVSTSIAGFIAPRMVVERNIGSVLLSFGVLLFLGYGFFCSSAPLGVRRFLIGTEVWGAFMHIEHFIRFGMLVCPPFFCVGMGYVSSDKCDAHPSVLKSYWYAFGIIAFFLWYFFVVISASTTLVLDVLEVRWRAITLFLFFSELSLGGYLLGSLSSLVRDDASNVSILYATCNVFLGAILSFFLLCTGAILFKASQHLFDRGFSFRFDDKQQIPIVSFLTKESGSVLLGSFAFYLILYVLVECLFMGRRQKEMAFGEADGN